MKTITFLSFFLIAFWSCEKKQNYVCECITKDTDVGIFSYGAVVDTRTVNLTIYTTPKKAKKGCSAYNKTGQTPSGYQRTTKCTLK